MPRFDFTCQDCGVVFETVVPLYDLDAACCPKCGESDLLRHFPNPAIHVFYSPCHPRHKRGMVGHKPVAVTPQFRKDAPFLKRKKKKNVS